MMKQILFLILYASMKTNAILIPDVLEFFPETGNDASKVSWAHAVNSRTELAAAITDPNVMMLEADILEGLLTTSENSSDFLPIMSHLPKKTSDISLEEWFLQVIKENEQLNRKGAKLDFKETEMVETSLVLITDYSSEINFPIWLNADILDGPGGQNKTSIDPNYFLSICKLYFPEATLSLGWTTGYSSKVEYRYTKRMVEDMSTSIKNNDITQPITFPVRAALIKGSVNNLINLMDMVPNCTFTVWSAASDDVDMHSVADLIIKAGSKRVYIDIPHEQMEALQSVLEEYSNSSNAASSSNSGFISLALVPLFILLGY